MSSIPIIDFSESRADSEARKKAFVEQVRSACLSSGFFQIINHGVPEELQSDIIQCSKEFFALPLEIKESYNKDLGQYNRGYERLRAQNFEKRTEGDLKEGYYFGVDLPASHPKVLAGKFGLGPNTYPQHVSNPAKFKATIDAYHTRMRRLAKDIVLILCKTLEVEDSWVDEHSETPIAVLRLLHYPPQAPDASEFERGIGAHTDFGAITILLQDQVGGLQVLDRISQTWVDVVPTSGALVVNLGNLMMRWTNDLYISNLHRVINKTGKERYSVPFFYSGNPDFKVESFTGYSGTKPKYEPVTVGGWISGRYADTYSTSKEKAVGELSITEAKAGLA